MNTFNNYFLRFEEYDTVLTRTAFQQGVIVFHEEIFMQ